MEKELNRGIWLVVGLVTLWVVSSVTMQIDRQADAADRSRDWPAVRAVHIANHPTCEACGSKKHIEVHHVLPVQFWSEKELDPTNLITLCRTCHRVFGHLHNTRSYNLNVREDAVRHLTRVKARPKTKADLQRFQQQFQNAP